jgi:replicative DNA helicase
MPDFKPVPCLFPTRILHLLYCDQVYNPDTERRHILDVIIGKNCNGSRGEVSLYYHDTDFFIRDLERNESLDLEQ